MEKITRYESASVFKPQPVASSAEGDAALSEAFGTVAKASISEAATIMKEESNFNMMKASSQAHSDYTDAQIEMEKNPGMSGEILRNFEKRIGAFSQYEMNPEDRSRFNAFTSNLRNDAKLKTTKFQIGLANLSASGLVYDTSTQQIKALQQLAATGNLDQAGNVADMIHDTAADAVKTGVISLSAYDAMSKSVQEAVIGGSRFHQAFSEKGMTALDVHMANWSPLGPVHDVADLPSNNVTKHISNYLNEQRTVENLDQALINSEIEVPEFSGEYWNMSQNAQKEYVQKFMGIRRAYAMVASNHDFHAMESRMKELKYNKETNDISEKFELQYYEKIHRDLENGKSYWGVMSKTSEGASALRQYNAELASQQQFPGAESNNGVLQDPFNKLMGTMVSVSKASNMNPDYIKPIPEKMITDMRGSFAANGDASVLIKNLKSLNFSNRSYAANQFEDKTQKEAVRMIAYGMDNYMTPEFMATSVNALKEGNNFEALARKGEKGVETKSDNVIKNKLNSEISSITNHLSSIKDPDRINGLIDYGTKFIKQRAIENNDIEIKHLDKYVDEFVINAEKSYNIKTSYNYSFNKTQHNLSNSEYSALAAYGISRARKNLSGGISDVQFESIMSKTNLMATFDEHGDVVVIDDDGRSVYKEDYTDHLMADVKREGSVLTKEESYRFSKKVQANTALAKKYG